MAQGPVSGLADLDTEVRCRDKGLDLDGGQVHRCAPPAQTTIAVIAPSMATMAPVM